MAATVFEVDPVVVERELGGLVFSRILSDNPMLMVRAAHWHNQLDGLGLGLPFFLVHDIGLLLTESIGQTISLQERTKSLQVARQRGAVPVDMGLDELLKGYQQLLTDLARSELSQKAASGNFSDDLLAAVIAKVIEPVQAALIRKGHNRKLPLTVATYQEVEPAHYCNPSVSAEVKSILSTVVEARARIRVTLEQIDLDTLKLLEMFKAKTISAPPQICSTSIARWLPPKCTTS